VVSRTELSSSMESIDNSNVKASVQTDSSENEMKRKCSDLKCVQKPTRGRLSLTHLPVQPLGMVWKEKGKMRETFKWQCSDVTVL